MSESLLSTGNALWFGPICYGGEKNTSNEKEHQESLLAQQNGKHFQQNIHSSYFLCQKVKTQLRFKEQMKETSNGQCQNNV